MMDVLDKRILLLILSLLTNVETTKLSDQKKCGDPECETAMSRVQAIQDHTGPDCRFLNFKTGEEIMVYFKLSRTREDLWAGSKGQDFGFFPMNAVQVEEMLTTKEVEVPTKRTDFFCLDGGGNVLESEDGTLNGDDEETEHKSLYGDGDDSESLREISFGREFKEPFSERGEVGSKDGRPMEVASSGDSELGETGQDDSVQQEAGSQSQAAAAPTQPAWTVSGIAGWLGLGSQQDEDAAGKAHEGAGPAVFRPRRLIVMEEGDCEEPTEEAFEAEPKASGWFPRSLPGFLSFGSEKPGPGEPQESFPTPERQGSPGAPEAGREGSSGSGSPAWLRLQDLLPLGFSTESGSGREEPAGGEAAQPEGPRRTHQEQHLESHLQEAPGAERASAQGQEGGLGAAAGAPFPTRAADSAPDLQVTGKGAAARREDPSGGARRGPGPRRAPGVRRPPEAGAGGCPRVSLREACLERGGLCPREGALRGGASAPSAEEEQAVRVPVPRSFRQAVWALPEPLRPEPELLVCALAVLGLLLLLCRGLRSVRSRLYVGRETQLASKVAELVEEKRKLLEKLSLRKQETVHEDMIRSNAALQGELERLEKELEEEKVKQREQDDLMAGMQKRKESLANEVQSAELQIAEAKNTLKVYELNRERLKKSIEDATEENSHLQESEKQLLQEVEGWGERFVELSEQAKMLESSKAEMEEAIKNKESQVKSLTECLLKMTDWSCVPGEQEAAEGDHVGHESSAEVENGEHADDQEKKSVRKLIQAVKLNAQLKSLETERDQIYSKLTDEIKAKEELTESIENLQKEHKMLQSENAHLESEVQKLREKLKVMTELYQENEMNLHRKLTVEGKERLQKEEKLSKVDDEMSHAAEELINYRQRAKDLEEEMERTLRSYQSQILSHEKKAHDNWLAARAAERLLNEMKKENAISRQKLTEAEFKCTLLEKDPYAHDVRVRPFVREHSPYGPSPKGRPSSETRAFLSPPTLLEGPLRLSPVLPGGGGRESRGARSSGRNEASRERDGFPDPRRPSSDTGSLSPPWDRERRIIPPPAGQPYSDPSLPFPRPGRLYCNPPNSGRLSGPAALRSSSRQSLDEADEQGSEINSRMDLSGNGSKDRLNESNMLHGSEQHLPAESEALGPGPGPPALPLLRAPLMPGEPRGPYLRRGSPFPPVPPHTIYGPPEFFPRNPDSKPRPPLPVRGPVPGRPFSPYSPPMAGRFPPPPPPLNDKNELPAEATQPATMVSSADIQRSQEETRLS